MRAAVIFAMAAVSVLAADVSGKWQGEMKTPNGPLETSIVLKVEGDKVTGTVTNMYGEEQITDGVVKGDEISFVVLAGGQFRLAYKGKVDGDQLKFTVDAGEMGTGEMVAKRV